MIDELKLILDAIGDIGPYAIAVVFGFFVYKSALYLGSIGVLYKGMTMIVNKIHDYKTKQIDSANTKAQYEHARSKEPVEYTFAGILLDEGARNEVLILLNSIRNRKTSDHLHYVHASDVRHINKIIDAHYDKKEHSNN